MRNGLGIEETRRILSKACRRTVFYDAKTEEFFTNSRMGLVKLCNLGDDIEKSVATAMKYRKQDQ